MSLVLCGPNVKFVALFFLMNLYYFEVILHKKKYSKKQWWSHVRAWYGHGLPIKMD